MHALERLELVGAKNENVYVPAYVVKKKFSGSTDHTNISDGS